MAESVISIASGMLCLPERIYCGILKPREGRTGSIVSVDEDELAKGVATQVRAVPPLDGDV